MLHHCRKEWRSRGYSVKFILVLQPTFLFVLVTMAIFKIYPHSYTFSKLIIFLTKSQQHININWQKKGKKNKQTNKQQNNKTNKKCVSNACFQTKPITQKTQTVASSTSL